MDYDFIEIGTSDFHTLIECATDETVGISIEPLKVYLDNLPNKKNVIKLNAAMSIDSSSDDIDIYYIPPNVIDKQQLDWWLRGCNRVGNYHPFHLQHPVNKANLTEYVQVDKVKQISFKCLYEIYNIYKVNHLKLDTEGFDCHILQQFLIFLKNKDPSYYPKQITFETNTQTSIEFVNKTVQDFIYLGYKISSFKYDDRDGSTILVYE